MDYSKGCSTRSCVCRHSHRHDLVPLREGLILVNGGRITEANLPEVFREWDVIYFKDVITDGYVGTPFGLRWLRRCKLTASRRSPADCVRPDARRRSPRTRQPLLPHALTGVRGLVKAPPAQ